MPEAGSKKKQAPSAGSGKAAKRGASFENAPIIDVLINHEETPQEEESEQENIEIVQPPLPDVVRDIMRTEPVLNKVFIQTYEGEHDENGFYHGEGCAKLNDNMVYAGTFLHGKMNGGGRLEWSDGTVFEGDFVNNTISGKGFYTWPDGSTYEGDVALGLRHGTGRFTCVDMKVYSGQWKNGHRHGTGVLYYDENGLSYYNGEWVENEKCGRGTRRFLNGNIYEGEWRDNIRNGQGTMYWHNSGQEYTGEWVDGIQHGKGEYSWYLKRVSNSQYPLRNKYIGDFCRGERHGHGVFHYASGAKYEGAWEHDMKHGHGKFTFKNGSVYVGQFCKDHMVDFPDLILPRMQTPDIESCGIPVTSSMSSRSKSALAVTRNAIVDAFLDINLDELFLDYAYDLEDREAEVENIMRTVLRYSSKLKNIYKVYSCLGSLTSEDNTFIMSKCQFLRFLKDYNLQKFGFSLAQIDRYLEDDGITLELCFKKLLMRDFLSYLVRTSYYLFKDEVGEDANVYSSCFTQLMSVIVSAENCAVKGCVYKSIRNTEEVNKFIDAIFNIYFYFYQSHGHKLNLLHVVHIFKDMRLITGTLTCTELVRVLTKEETDDEGFYNLEQEITPFEFVEVIVAVSSVFINDDLVAKHRPSHIVPLLSLNTLNVEQSAVDFKQEVDELRKSGLCTEEAPPTDGGGENVSHVSSNVGSTAVSPIKSSKSTSRAPRRSGVWSKKGEKESSASNVSRGKKEGSRGTGRQSSSTKLDEPKKMHNSDAADAVDEEVNQGIVSDKSHESAVEQFPSVVEGAVIGSELELAVESSMEVELQQNLSKDVEVKQEEIAESLIKNDEAEVEDEGFEMWSLRLNLFLKEYFFPKFEHFKMLTQMVKDRKEQGVVLSDGTTVVDVIEQ